VWFYCGKRVARSVDLTLATSQPRVREANVKSKTALETHICRCPFDSNIRKDRCRNGMQMLEPDR